ncbi:PIN domain-like protein [Heliocybe sulcata]|uniref:PIN domain-like protein n=1 Tax=Heliocybe sulcata TaxID=5364 RepID=A0A5C3MN24_9AGAM|nr:PIN domain-like protein [Heliocybe sulcata]
MGITGLLPILKPIQTQRHLSEFLGQTLAVDAYVWLHRGVYACATDLAMGRKTTKYVEYAMHRIRLLLHHKIQPFVVFDGGPLPAKAPTETSRKKRREDSLALGQELAKRGKRKEAREHFIKSIDVGTEMAFQLIKALKAEGIPYIVAPYEADAQLAYLERLGVVDGIITEDSDLLVFGCKKVLFKLDAVSQTVTCISQSDFASVDGSNGGGISLQTFTPSQFRHMCMLSGCDYLPSIPGIGLRTAYALLRTHKSMENVVRAVRLEGKKSVPKDYTKMFRLAEKAFSHQRVWDPFQEKLVYLTDPEGEELDEEADSYVGWSVFC